jgi:hypothetical protein
MKALALAIAISTASFATHAEPLTLNPDQMDSVTAGAQPEVTGVVVESAHDRNEAGRLLRQDLKEAKEAGLEI